MTVTELIEQLLEMPQEAEVEVLMESEEWATGWSREIVGIYLSKSNGVIIHSQESLSKISIVDFDQPNPIQP